MFSESEKKYLQDNGVGDEVINRLQRLGYARLHDLKTKSVEELIDRVSLLLGSQYWKNLPSARYAMALVVYLASTYEIEPICELSTSTAAVSDRRMSAIKLSNSSKLARLQNGEFRRH